MSLVSRLRAWWNRDTVELAKEESGMSPVEREQAEEDFEARKDDVAVRERFASEGVDFERDSEPPRHP